MKVNHINGFIFLIIFLIFANQACAEDWEFRGYLPRGTGFFDKDSIKKINNRVYQVWTVTIYNNKGKEDAFSILKRHDNAPDRADILTHELILLEFDCENEKYRIASINIFDEIGSMLLSAPEINDKWREIIPKSINETLKNKVCSTERASEAVKK